MGGCLCLGMVLYMARVEDWGVVVVEFCSMILLVAGSEDRGFWPWRG